jgi:4'-phosphopantetheinyl transferase
MLGGSFKLACLVRANGVFPACSSAGPDFPGFDLAEGDVHVWRVGLLALSRDSDWMCLSADELERAQRFHFALDRQRFLVDRAARRHILSGYLKVAPSSIRFLIGAHGKPAIVGQEFPQGLRFNCTHSGELALIAVSRGIEIGVDVEQHRLAGVDSGLLDQVFTPRERAEFDRIAPESRRKAFFDAWTRKEALLKATGLGLSCPLHHIEVTIAPEHPPACRAWAGGPDAAQHWQMVTLDVGTDYSATLVIEHDAESIVM